MNKIIVFIFFMPLFVISQNNFEKGEKLFLQEKYALAKPLFELHLKENPSHLMTMEYLGDISIHQKDWDKALFYYQTLKKLKPSVANYYYKYGGALGLKSKAGGKWVAIQLIDDLKASFEKVLILEPKHIEARWALIEYYLKVPGLFGGSEKKAQAYANELMKLSVVDGYLSRAHIDEYFERFKSAEKNYLKAIEVGGSKATYDRLAVLYKTKLHQPDKAIKILETYKNKS